MNPSKTNLIVLAALAGALGIAAGTFLWLKLAPKTPIASWNAPALERLSNYGTAPEFSLIERSGKKITSAYLRGKVWIADFIYTTCKDTCPLQSAAMAKLQEKFRNRLRLVSFSVDPEHDTPQVLARYAERYHADGAGWLFLTGDKEQITQLVQLGFRLSAAALTDGDSKETVVLHSPRFILIDRSNEIRGYYDSREADALERLIQDATKLVNDKGSS